MDPLTHALTGATLGWAAAGKTIGRRALIVGAAAALLPDVDVFIRSAADPLLAIEHHRGFTHSLLFVPLGGAIAALPFVAKLNRAQRLAAVLAAILAYASHALLDAATTFGTQLFWPFSRYRVGLDIISIIDPLFTLFAAAGVIGAWRNRRRIVIAAIVLACVWLAVGLVQRERASAAQARLAKARGETIERGEVFPTVGNRVVWRSIYRTGGVLRMDRVRVPLVGEESHSVVAPGRMPDAVRAGRPPSGDLARFAWFADGWVARDPNDATLIGDARYSLHADRYVPVWGIRFRGGRTEWVDRSRERLHHFIPREDAGSAEHRR